MDVDPCDVLNLAAGTSVSIESMDAMPGSDAQNGKLVGLSGVEIVIELENCLRLHFPRQGYFVREVEQSN